MKYDFGTQIERKNTNSIKYDCVDKSATYPMWIADMDFACPEFLLDAVRARLEHPILGYSTTDDTYCQAVADWMKRRHKMDVDKQEIVTSCGVVTAMRQAVFRLTESGDGVLLQTPAYSPFYKAICEFSRKPVLSPLVYANGVYSLDKAEFAKKCDGVKLFFLCSPHNPTGRVWTKDELTFMAETCFERGIYVFCDEIHHDLTRKSSNMISLKELYPHEKLLITATSASKTFNVAGLAHSNIIICDRELAESWRACHACGNLNPLSAEACRAAYLLGDEWLDSLRDYLDGNIAFAKEYIEKVLPAAKVCDCQGTYLLWIDLNGLRLADDEEKRRVAHNGVVVEYGDEFVANGEGFVRMNVAMPRAVLKKALEAFCDALKN